MRALGALLVVAAGCGATVTSERVRGDAAVDAATPAVCRFAVGAPVVVSTPEEAQRFRLLDAIATTDGAVVAWIEVDADAGEALYVRRVRDDGSVHPWSAPGRASRAALATLSDRRLTQFSMVWEAARDAVTLLVSGAEGGGCALLRIVGDGTQLRRPIDVGALGGFAHGGCGSLAREGAGYTFLTRQVRALWGDELVSLTDDGRVVESTVVLPMTTRPSFGPMARWPVTGGFVATWGEALPTAMQLHARRFDVQGTPLGGDVIVGEARSIFHVVAVETPDGLLAVWRAQDEMAAPSNALTVRALARDATPTHDARILGGTLVGTGIHAAARAGDVLAVDAAPAADLALFVTDARGAPRVAPIPLVTGGSPVGVARVVPTARGALVVYESQSVAQGGRIFAVPVDCLP